MSDPRAAARPEARTEAHTAHPREASPQPCPLPPILDCRLLVVTGKGGTGKTTVVAALAQAAARAGRRVIVAETGRDEAVPGLLAPDAPPVGYAGRELQPGLRVMRVDPYEALGEYIGLQFGGRFLADRVLRNAAFRQLMDASPGWRELITLGKIWHLEQLEDPPGRARYDLLLVDAPATGHGITFLDVPRVVVSAVRAGPLRRHAGWVETMVRDAEATRLLPVALAEELPARETSELVERMRSRVGIAVDRVVVNAVTSSPLPEGVPDLAERLERLDEAHPLEGLPPPSVLAACLRHAQERAELNRHYVEVIRREIGLPVVLLPYQTGGIEGPADLEALGEALLAGPAQP